MAVTGWNQPEMMAQARRGAWIGVTEWMGMVEARAVELIMEPPKSGKIYRKRGVTHQASAPGEAPANDTGRLVNSRRIDLFQAELRQRLTFSTAYALALEVGTKNMEARPYARRALRETDAAGVAVVARRVKEAVNG